MTAKYLATLLRQVATSRQTITQGYECDVERLIEVFERNPDRSIDEVVRAIDKAWPPPKQAKKKAVAVASLDPSQWVEKLNGARQNAPGFENLLSELQKSKSLKTADVVAVANGFRGTSKKYKSRKAAVDDVRLAWLESQRDASKVRNIGGIF